MFQAERDRREKLQDAHAGYDVDVAAMETWLEQAEQQYSSDPVLGLDPEHLEQELKDNDVSGINKLIFF